MTILKTISTNKKQGVYQSLPRGGYLVETSVGYMQVGSPPETIKDTMRFKRSTPQIFILPKHFFDVHKGISVAELEFPIYYNHFLRQKKTYIVCAPEQREQLIIVLRESIFGPEKINLHSEYINGEASRGYPNMKAEMEYFRGDRTLHNLVQFVIFKDNIVKFNKVTIKKTKDDDFLIDDEDWNTTFNLPGEVGFRIIQDTGKAPSEPYKPPQIGITCLGPSHGFDVEDNTSGFLLWIHRNGVMVDPPVNSTEWLTESNVNPAFINSIILTHTHADHDAGTFQKILEGNRITIYSTETVMHSFIKKYNALTQIPIKELYSLFDFVPIIIGRVTIINTAEFSFFYALHSIPSLGFSFNYQNQSFIYSSDHLNDTNKFKELLEKGVLNKSRYEDLMNFPWYSNIIYHEAGIPPLHTRIEYLQTLPKEIQKKMTVYHLARRDMPKNTDLTLATFGIENTYYPPIDPPKNEETLEILDVLSNVDIFRNFPITKAKDFLNITEKENFSKGTVIIKKGTIGDKFYMIMRGNVRVEGIEQETLTNENNIRKFSSYEYFGEASLISGEVRSAGVIAETDVTALTIKKNSFLNFIQGSELNERFSYLAKLRTTGTWNVLSRSRFFRSISSAQRTQIELIMKLEQYPTEHVFIEKNEIADMAYIIKTGAVEVLDGEHSLEVLSQGDFFGEIFMLQKEAPSSFTFQSLTDVNIYTITRKDLIQYIKNNPGVYMRLNHIYGE